MSLPHRAHLLPHSLPTCRLQPKAAVRCAQTFRFNCCVSACPFCNRALPCGTAQGHLSCPVLSTPPCRELQVDCTDPCASPGEGCSHPISLLARTCPWDGTLQSFVCLPFPGSSSIPWGLTPKAASHRGHHKAHPSQEHLAVYSSFYQQP